MLGITLVTTLTCITMNWKNTVPWIGGDDVIPYDCGILACSNSSSSGFNLIIFIGLFSGSEVDLTGLFSGLSGLPGRLSDSWTMVNLRAGTSSFLFRFRFVTELVTLPTTWAFPISICWFCKTQRTIYLFSVSLWLLQFGFWILRKRIQRFWPVKNQTPPKIILSPPPVALRSHRERTLYVTKR